MRNQHNREYREIFAKSGLLAKNKEMIAGWGGTDAFEQGLYGAPEMLVDPFMQMYKNNILKRKVYDSLPLMKLLNIGQISENHIPEDIIDTLNTVSRIYATCT